MPPRSALLAALSIISPKVGGVFVSVEADIVDCFSWNIMHSNSSDRAGMVAGAAVTAHFFMRE